MPETTDNFPKSKTIQLRYVEIDPLQFPSRNQNQRVENDFFPVCSEHAKNPFLFLVLMRDFEKSFSIECARFLNERNSICKTVKVNGENCDLSSLLSASWV